MNRKLGSPKAGAFLVADKVPASLRRVRGEGADWLGWSTRAASLAPGRAKARRTRVVQIAVACSAPRGARSRQVGTLEIRADHATPRRSALRVHVGVGPTQGSRWRRLCRTSGNSGTERRRLARSSACPIRSSGRGGIRARRPSDEITRLRFGPGRAVTDQCSTGHRPRCHGKRKIGTG